MHEGGGVEGGVDVGMRRCRCVHEGGGVDVCMRRCRCVHEEV